MTLRRLIWMGVGGVAGAVLAQPRILVKGLRAFFPQILWEIDSAQPTVALTFDDGPDPIFTQQALQVLNRYNVKATFFLVGERARRYPQIVEAIRFAGHEIANHSDTWSRTISLGIEDFEQDLLRAEKTLEITGAPKFFRPAGAMIRPSQMHILRKHGYTCVLGSAYAFDPYRPPAAFISWNICRMLRPGGIIVLHDSGGDRSNTVAALPGIIEGAHMAGLRFTTLSQLYE